MVNIIIELINNNYQEIFPNFINFIVNSLSINISNILKRSFSTIEDNSQKLDYFKNKLRDLSNKELNKKNKNNINDIFKRINFENFDSNEINIILKDKNTNSKKLKENKIEIGK